jgi:hypothetical protein
MLPSCFKPSGSYDLARLGRDHDGGYLVESGSLEKAGALVSMGINTDWSFEKDFVARNPVPLNAYDHTTGHFLKPIQLLKTVAGVCLFRYPFSRLTKELALRSDYRAFFTGQNIHYREKIGPASLHGVSLKETLARLGQSAPVFLKIDIEGSEYRLLGELVECADRIVGLTIEFHDIDLHRERIVSFIKAFPLTLVHIHPNNFGGKDENGDPFLIELTFALNPGRLSATVTLPHALDQHNDIGTECISLIFETA